MEPSKYQTAIFDFIKNRPSDSLVINALAGSGKTTTIIQSLSLIASSERVLMVAFNKHIADELASRAPSNVTCSTLHSLGLSNIRRAFKRVQVNKWKNSTILNAFFPDPRKVRSTAERKTASVDRMSTERLISLAKATLRTPSVELAEHYGIDFVDERHVAAASAALERATEVDELGVDFDDMIYLCAIGFVACQKFTTVIVDEAQDLNESQIAMLLKSRASDSSRLIAVGDPQQSIYGFRGAAGAAMETLSNAAAAQQLPLSICYRCARSIVLHAQLYVPQIEYHDTSPEGVVDGMPYNKVAETLAAGDYVVCRINAPLFLLALDLIRRGIKPVLRGRDFANQLTSIVKRLIDQCGSSLDEFRGLLYEWRDSSLENCRNSTRRNDILDKVDVLTVCSSVVSTPHELVDFVDNLFSEKSDAVTLSSIHRAKGLEANRVFWLQTPARREPLLEWEISIERTNLPYVATTRAKRELWLVPTNQHRELELED